MAKSNKNWTSEEVKTVIEKMKLGSDDVKETPFFNNDPDLRAANIIFTHTPEELAEFIKCSQDCVYFTSKYCNFLTDFGRKPVKLRKYQKELLKAITEEEFIPDLNDMGPVRRDVAIMASRQTGKCLVYNTNVLNLNKELKIGSLFKETSFFLPKIKQFLYKIYCKL
ncbi:MAG: hypothetical protein RSE41_06870 [Clostridia bacterium]